MPANRKTQTAVRAEANAAPISDDMLINALRRTWDAVAHDAIASNDGEDIDYDGRCQFAVDHLGSYGAEATRSRRTTVPNITGEALAAAWRALPDARQAQLLRWALS